MKRILLVAIIVLWFGGVVAALLAVWSYKSKSSPIGAAPARWPSASKITRATDRPDLIVFAHPQCPCTKATMTELDRVATDLRGAARIHVVLVHPDGTADDFEDGPVRDRARSITGVDVFVDDGEVESKRFGAVTSGTTVLYAQSGELLFSGGLTTARGHEGEGPAHDRILAAVAGRTPDRRDAPVFGCSLANPELATRKQ